MAKKQKNPVPVSNDWDFEDESFGSQQDSAPNISGGAPTQLPPIIQPIAFVPYTTQEQPLWQAMMPNQEEENYYYQEEAYGAEEDYYSEGASKKSKSRSRGKSGGVSAAAIVSIIFSVLIIGVLIAGEYVLQEYLGIMTLAGSLTSGYGFIMELIDVISKGDMAIDFLLIPGAVAIIAVATVINLIASIIRVKRRGACLVSKICLFIMVMLSLVLILIGIIDDRSPGYGLYAVAGLSFIAMLVAYLAKKD